MVLPARPGFTVTHGCDVMTPAPRFLKKTALPENRSAAGDETTYYFERLKRRLLIILLVAFLTPLALLSVYFHLQFSMTLKQSGKMQLRSLAESQRNTMDLFLQERVVNIFNLFRGGDFTINPGQEDMDRYLRDLQETSEAFIDVGFFTQNGNQAGYAGPYPYLRQKNYSGEKWFQTLLNQKSNYYISDIYMGFRNQPHFTIAVKQVMADRHYILRATLDPDKFYRFLRTIGQGEQVNSFLLNRSGVYQVVDPAYGEVLQESRFVPEYDSGSHVAEVDENGAAKLAGYAWLQQAPWVLVVKQPLQIAYSRMYDARRYIIGGTALTVMAIFAGVLLLTSRLLKKAEQTERDRDELKSQLYHAAKLVSVGELAAGVAHEINNPLAIILSQCGVIRDLFDPEVGGNPQGSRQTPQQVVDELTVIENAVTRARDITQKLLSSARKTDPQLMPCNLNEILDEVVSGFMEKEFSVDNIALVRKYDENLPEIMLDPDQLRQVFQNLINNAADAIAGPGRITLQTRKKDHAVEVLISDTGRGMTCEEMNKIFMPFFTTKEAGKGTGLGLGISLSIVEAVDGTIDVQSLPGAGSTFIITLPLDSGVANEDESDLEAITENE